MWQIAARITCAASFLIVAGSTTLVRAVAPPLQNAYWRFEEGTADEKVTPRNENVVLDSSGNSNHLRAFADSSDDAAPTYRTLSTIETPKPLKSGLTNTLGLDFVPNQDLYSDGREINNGVIASGGGFTIEAAFYTYNPARWGGIIAKEGLPNGGDLPTFALKTNADTSALTLQQYDAAGNLITLNSTNALNAEQWYYTAVVNDGSQVSLWLDSGDGYELQGQADVAGALYQGTDNNWNKAWTIGRAVFDSDSSRPDGIPADWFDGLIDEVRISNTPLAPSDFLFAEPSTTIDGDFNEDGTVDAADYVTWRKTMPGDGAAYNTWRTHFGESNAGSGGTGSVPEPASVTVTLLALTATLSLGRPRSRTTAVVRA